MSNNLERCHEIVSKFYNKKDNELVVGEIPITEIADRFGTPAYVYDESILESQLRNLRAAFSNEFSIFYSMKANPDSRVLSFFAKHADGIEVASGGELKKAIDSGCSCENILFAGPGKTAAEIEQAIKSRISEIHVESIVEASRINSISKSLDSETPICIRVNPSTLQGGAMRMGGLPAQFGIDEERLESTINEIKELKHVALQGVHLFVGTQILDAELLLSQYEQFISIANQVAQQISLELVSIDFGGGLGVPYFENEKDLDLQILAEGIPKITRKIRAIPLLKNAKLIVEPGRFLTADAGVYVTKVNDIKVSRDRKFVIVDGGLHHHLAATGNLGQVIKRNYPVACLNRLEAENGPVETVDIVGPLCTPLDRLGRAVELPKIEIGDVIGVFRSGAYGRSASPLGFLSHRSPAEVYVKGAEAGAIRVCQVDSTE